MTSLALSDPLNSPRGHSFAREVLRKRVGHDIHDYVLEGVCRAVEGQHIIAVTKTSGGKTGYLWGFLLMLQELAKACRPWLSLARKVPARPAIIVIYPTKCLEETMVSFLDCAHFYPLNLTGYTFRSINFGSLALTQSQSMKILSRAHAARLPRVASGMTLLTPTPFFSLQSSYHLPHSGGCCGRGRFRLAFADSALMRYISSRTGATTIFASLSVRSQPFFIACRQIRH